MLLSTIEQYSEFNEEYPGANEAVLELFFNSNWQIYLVEQPIFSQTFSCVYLNDNFIFFNSAIY